MQRDLALFRSFNGSFALESIWQQFCSNPPKGFEKYYKSGGAAADKKADSQDVKSTENPKPEVSDPPPSRSSSSSSDNKLKTSPKNEWNFGMFGQTGKSGGSGGTPIGGEGNDKEKWLLIGALTVVALIGGLAFMEMGYKEIGWKEFVNRLVERPTAYVYATAI